MIVKTTDWAFSFSPSLSSDTSRKNPRQHSIHGLELGGSFHAKLELDEARSHLRCPHCSVVDNLMWAAGGGPGVRGLPFRGPQCLPFLQLVGALCVKIVELNVGHPADRCVHCCISWTR